MSEATQSSKPPRVTRRRAETRKRLLDAAQAVFAEEGFGRASVEDVCERAGYTRGAFYSNFASLDQLFLAMWEQRFAALLDSISAALAATAEETVTLEDGIDRMLAVIPVDDHWYRIEAEFTAHALRDPSLRGVVAEREAQIAAALLPFIDRALARVGRRVVDRDAFAAALVAVHDGTVVQCLVAPDDPEAQRHRRELFLTVVDGYTRKVD